MSMNQAAVAVEKLEVSPELIVTEVVSSRDAFVTWTIDAHENGLVLRRTPADLSPSRFMWLEFDLPSGHGLPSYLYWEADQRSHFGSSSAVVGRTGASS